MSSLVYFGSARQRKLAAAETLPAKLDRILDRLKIRERVGKKSVAIKMHLGGNIGYSTIHPVFVRKVVQAVLEGGGKPFVTDTAGACRTAPTRGYTTETIGCPIIPVAGPGDRHFKTVHRPFKNITDWELAGTLVEADFLIDLAHVKGHPSCGFGALFKNLALGGMTGRTRGALHDTQQFDPYFFPEKVATNGDTLQKIIDSCPRQALVRDETDASRLHLHFDPCNQCMRCVQVAPPGSLKIDRVNFSAFPEAQAISASLILEHFKDGRATFISIANQLTAVCDCFGFTGPSVIPDVGIFGGDDIVATEQAMLDAVGQLPVLYENVPDDMEAQPKAGHPFQILHGPLKDPYVLTAAAEKLGLGSRRYGLVDVMDEAAASQAAAHISAKHM